MAPRPEVTVNVVNQSSREGAKPKLIVLHTTEGHERAGLDDLKGLANWFNRPSVQASSHVANDAEGNDARFVPDNRKAWTQKDYNRVSLSIEQIGKAAESRKEWMAQPKQLSNTARWIAYWSKKHDIPIRQGRTAFGRVLRSGVVQHSSLGRAGGNHSDCGPGFPFDYVLDLARRYAKTPAPKLPEYPGVIREGHKGADVKRIQQELKDRGHTVSVDGDFGPKTQRTVVAFQRKNLLTGDGIVGPKTWKALFG